MSNNHDETTEKLRELYDQMPEKLQHAFIWLIENFEDVEQMCKGEPLSQEMREQSMERARRNDDTYMVVLLAAEQVINAQKETSEEERR